MITFGVTTQQVVIMGKNTNFSGQPIFNQLIKFIDKGEIRKIARKHSAERYVNVFHIEIQIWKAMLANLLITLVKSKLKRNWAFSNLVSVIRQQLMSYINMYRFLEDPEGS